jgi:hypothetical protein
VLAHNFDSLTLAIDVSWLNDRLFQRLLQRKDEAQSQRQPMPEQLHPDDRGDPWLFNVQPHGSNGYTWLLEGSEMTWRVGYWLEPQQRPSLMVELSSEMLWHRGPHAAVEAVRSLIEGEGGRVHFIKASRADLCVDLLLPEPAWNLSLLDRFVGRAQTVNPHIRNGALEGIGIGSGQLSARLYDKPREIRQKSGKWWMFDVWKLEKVPKNHYIIRVEFQIRREKLSELKAGTVWYRARDDDDHGIPNHNWPLFASASNLWAYCTQNWLNSLMIRVNEARIKSFCRGGNACRLAFLTLLKSIRLCLAARCKPGGSNIETRLWEM